VMATEKQPARLLAVYRNESTSHTASSPAHVWRREYLAFA
jgi:hypothetical protein